jgi:hypothetical protein
VALKQKGNDGDGGGGGSHPHLLNLWMAHIQCYPIPFLHTTKTTTFQSNL